MTKQDLWEINISEAKSLLRSKKGFQMQVGRLALEVCEVKWGGSSESLRTIKDFAREVGVNPKTLSNWMALYRDVYSKISSDIRAKASVSDLNITHRMIEKDTKPSEINKILGRMLFDASPDRRLFKYLGTMSSILTNMEREETVALCSQDTLEEILFYSTSITKAIRKNADKQIKPIDHNIAAANSDRRRKLMGTGASIAWKLKPRDEEVLSYLKRQEKSMTPKSIAYYLFKDSSDPSRLRTHRSLTKLKEAGLVCQDERAKYYFKQRKV